MAVLSPDALSLAEAEFCAAYPAYTTDAIEELRATEYHRLDAQRHTYLDYTGGSLYAQSQLRFHHDLLANGVFGNPHSGNPAALAMTDLVEQTRLHVLDYFGASAEEYTVIFTSNASGALKLVGEAYPFAEDGRLLLTVDNHNSVNGLREFARRKGAAVSYGPIAAPDLRLQPRRLDELLELPALGAKLFAFPAQSNFSGVQHDLHWIDAAQRRGWHVLLDAAAFVPTSSLNLRTVSPDFVALSFYKMFGYPTGSGALIARKEALGQLERPWFAGGTITVSSVRAASADGKGYYLTPGSAGFEDGTVNYLNLPAVDFGLRWLEAIGVESIHRRVTCLTDWLLDQLLALCHTNGSPVVRVYGPHTSADRGATIALNFVDPDGTLWNCWHVEALANEQTISLRAGCHCNPGAREVALDLQQDELTPLFRDKRTRSYEQYVQDIEPHLSGVVRVSLGIASNFADAHRFLEFASEFVDRSSA